MKGCPRRGVAEIPIPRSNLPPVRENRLFNSRLFSAVAITARDTRRTHATRELSLSPLFLSSKGGTCTVSVAPLWPLSRSFSPTDASSQVSRTFGGDSFGCPVVGTTSGLSRSRISSYVIGTRSLGESARVMQRGVSTTTKTLTTHARRTINDAPLLSLFLFLLRPPSSSFFSSTSSSSASSPPYSARTVTSVAAIVAKRASRSLLLRSLARTTEKLPRQFSEPSVEYRFLSSYRPSPFLFLLLFVNRFALSSSSRSLRSSLPFPLFLV